MAKRTAAAADAVDGSSLTLGQVYSLFQALSALDAADDLKLAGETRLTIAINLNRLTPEAIAYERTTTRMRADLMKANRALAEKSRRSNDELEDEFGLDVDKLRARKSEIALKTMLKADLRIEDNPKIKARTIADLLPILDDIEP